MAAIKIAVNGFDRIGRSAFKIAQGRNDVHVVAIRSEYDVNTTAYLLKHDSVYGNYARAVKPEDNYIAVGESRIDIVSNLQSVKKSWQDRMVDVVIDTTNTDSVRLKEHIVAGAKQVVAMSTADTIETVIMGVNDDSIGSISPVVSAGEPGAVAIAPVLAVLEQAFAPKKSALTVIDGGSPVDDTLRTKRTQQQNIIPAPFAGLTPSRQALGQQTIDGLSIHTPVANVGLAVITAVLAAPTTTAIVNQVFERAAKEPFYQGIINTTNKPLVSFDLRGSSYSATVDTQLTRVIGGDLVQLAVWFDSEWGYANRLVELSVDAGRVARNRT